MNDVVLAIAGVADGFRQVVVEGKMRGSNVGEVGGDVAASDVNLAILHIFWVDKFDVVNQVEFVEQNGTDEAIKVAAGDEAEFFLSHA